MGAPEPGTIRLDKWLWQARFCKSRAIAARLVSEDGVRVNRSRVTKPAAPVRVGDGLSFAVAGRVRVVRVLALGTRRGPASEARMLYDDLDGDRGGDPAPDARPEPARPGLEPDPEADK